MPSSPSFIRIKSDVLKIVAAIPQGRLCTYAAIGEYLDVAPRHVAYILSTLEPLEKSQYPWQRVVASDGKLGKLKRSAMGETQSELLRAEGHRAGLDTLESDYATALIDVADLPSGVGKQTRPARLR